MANATVLTISTLAAQAGTATPVGNVFDTGTSAVTVYGTVSTYRGGQLVIDVRNGGTAALVAAVLAGERVTSVRRFGQTWLKTRISPAVGAEGQWDTVVGLSTDLGGWMPAESELEPNIELVQNLIDCFPIAAFVVDCERAAPLTANAVARGLLGIKPSDATTDPWRHGLDVIHPDDRARVVSQLDAARVTGLQPSEVGTVRLRTHDARCVAASVRWSPVGPPERAPHRYVVGIFQEQPDHAWEENTCLTCSILPECRSPHLANR